jgi:hypothetical protein
MAIAKKDSTPQKHCAAEKCINVTKKAYKHGNSEKQIPQPAYHKEE